MRKERGEEGRGGGLRQVKEEGRVGVWEAGQSKREVPQRTKRVKLKYITDKNGREETGNQKVWKKLAS